jgi:hypothetical protein
MRDHTARWAITRRATHPLIYFFGFIFFTKPQIRLILIFQENLRGLPRWGPRRR